MLRNKIVSVLAVVLMCAISSSAMAQANNSNGQDQGGNSGRGGRNRGGGGNFDPAAFRQRMMDDLKKDMGSKDDEWTVLQPKIEKVWDTSRELRSGGGGWGGRSSRGGGNNNSSSQGGDTAVAKAQADLQSALDDKSIGADEISKRLAALRSAKDTAKQSLVKAQGELKELCNARQEAVLVMRGMLD